MTTNNLPVALLSEDDFQAAIAGPTRIKDTAKTAAYRVLVKGEGVSDVAHDMGIQRQVVSRAAQTVRALHLAQKQYPTDWVQAVVVAPIEMLKVFENAVERARKKAMKGI